MKRRELLVAVPAILLSACAADPKQALLDTNGESQLKLRQIQTRYFDIADKKKTLEAVLATLQDLGFVIDKTSFGVGSVTASKYSGYVIRMTVNVRPKGKEQMTVRASGQYGVQAITDPILYQSFFDALSKSLFLQAHAEE